MTHPCPPSGVEPLRCVERGAWSVETGLSFRFTLHAASRSTLHQGLPYNERRQAATQAIPLYRKGRHHASCRSLSSPFAIRTAPRSPREGRTSATFVLTTCRRTCWMPLLTRAGVPASAIEDIQWGCVKQQGEQGYDIARMAALIAGLPIEVGGATDTRLCGSSLQAIHQAAQSIAANCEDVRDRWRRRAHAAHSHGTGLRRQPRIYLRHSPATMQMGVTAETWPGAHMRSSRRESRTSSPQQ